MSQKALKKLQESPHEAPAYGIAEAARYLKIASATLRSWVVGRSYPRGKGSGFFHPLVTLADRDSHLLSFSNLVEAHVLRALRTEHGVSVRDLRAAVRYAEKELGVTRLLLSNKLRTAERSLFLKKYGTLINLSRAGQLAMEQVLEAHLKRVDWKRDVPVRLYPFVTDDSPDAKLIFIDPSVQFGRPVLISKGVSTEILVVRIDAGESIKDIAIDYGLTETEVRTALVYERAA
jgi:uncharacterized protein (DUF433 family)